MTVKIRKVGNSNVLTVPNSININNTEFDVFEGIDGAIVFTPHQPNPFKDNEFVANHKMPQTEAFGGIGTDDIK
jgi:antitoxin component of MazEF toxin-antitoxin module